MPTTWRIDVRLGEGADAPVLRSATVSADSQEEALRRLADQLAGEPDPTVLDGQEEVSAAGEFAPGSAMPPLEMRVETDRPAATDAAPSA
jgi:hypothetical protein